VVGGGVVGGGVVGGGVVGGSALTVSVRASVASGLTPFLAVSVRLYGLSVAVPGSGVPLITPVAGSSFSPAGSVPWIRLTVGGGVPVRTGV
jgi:hypothetical protein